MNELNEELVDENDDNFYKVICYFYLSWVFEEKCQEVTMSVVSESYLRFKSKRTRHFLRLSPFGPV